MATEVNLPALGESVTEGTVTRWLKQVGDEVAVDEPLLEVSTDKVDTEIPSPVAGTLLEVKVEEDDTVEVGAVLAVIGDADEPSGDDTAGSDDSATPEAQPKDEGEAEKKAEQEEEIAEDKGELPEGDETPEAEKPSSDAGGSGGSSGGGGDATSVNLPALGESVTEGTVTRWLKAVGDEVAVDEPLLEVSTDKVDTEIPSPVAGTLLEIKVEEDETVEVGAELAIIGSGEPGGSNEASESATPEAQPKDEGEAEKKAQQEEEIAEDKGELPAGDETPESEKQPEPEKKAEPQEESAPEPTKDQEPAAQETASQDTTPTEQPGGTSGGTTGSSGGSDDGAAYVTPLVRKLAAQHGVELSSLTGSGVGGRIRKQDVLDAARAAKEAASAPAAAPAAPAAAARPRRPAPPPRRRRPLRSPRTRAAAPPRRSAGCARSSPSG